MTATPSLAPAVPPARPPAPRPKSVAFDIESPTSADMASPARRPLRSNATDPLSDRATSLLIRRTLCSPQLGEKSRDSQVPIDELLPPLTSRNDVDLQLYALLAIIMREFVQSWYSKITTDEHFVSEILHIIAHCSRALEQRFRKVDLESLVLDEIPDLLDKHITSYRISHSPIARQPVEVDPREAYHAMCPLPHLAPVPHPDCPDTISDQKENEALYRQLLVQGVLAILLPTEDLENPCLTSLVEQIFSELIIGNVIANKASQPWMLYEGICITARVLRQGNDQGVVVAETQNDSGGPKVDVKGRRSWSVRSMFLAVIQLGMLVVASLRFITTALVMASSLPARATPLDEKEALLDHDKSPPRSSDPVKAPILSCRVWTCLGNLFELSLRMPWLDGFLSLLQYGAVNGPGRIAGHDGPIDRLLSHHINSLFSPSNLPPLLRTLRGVLFPNNAPGKTTLFPPSSEAELQALRRRAAKTLWGLLPKGVGRLYFGGRLWRRSAESEGDLSDDEDLVDEMERLLLVLDDEYCNKHLMYSILELLLARLMPELTEKSVTELWEERLG
ncbi:related to MSS51 protein [Fusarium oxysporum]|uniref:Related to MSS51 protein n=1 Tax=Fusarium oxysporum TaxID=5507 RepID=A0A2H3T3Z7_FUSOX|nr:related to MSS51 protein [Fusarium oxysporum]